MRKEAINKLCRKQDVINLAVDRLTGQPQTHQAAVEQIVSTDPTLKQHTTTVLSEMNNSVASSYTASNKSTPALSIDLKSLLLRRLDPT